jgi:hypothetical protein
MMWLIIPNGGLRYAKIQHLREHPSLGPKEDIVWLHVTVNDTDGMRRIQRGKRLQRDLNPQLHRDAPLALQPIGQRFATKPLHHQVGLTTGDNLAKLEHVADIGMRDSGHYGRLVPHPSNRVLLLRVLGFEHLQRDSNPRALRKRLVDRSHPALPQHPKQTKTPTQRLLEVILR